MTVAPPLLPGCGRQCIGVVTGGATGSMAPSLSAKIILKIFPFFLNTILIRKTIRQDEESTNLRKNPS